MKTLEPPRLAPLSDISKLRTSVGMDAGTG